MRLPSAARLVPALLLTCLALLAAGSARPAATASAPDWPMFQGDAGHTGFIPASLGARPTFYLKWKRSLGELSLHPVTAADGKIFVSQSGYFNNPGVMVLDAASGRTLWSKFYGDVFTCNPPSYADGVLYIQTVNHADDTYLRAYDAENGEELFSSPHEAQWHRYFAPTIYDGTVYVNGGYFGGMLAFDALTGAERWFTALPSSDQWTPAVDEEYAYAYLGHPAPGLYALDRHTGEVAFRIPDPDFDWNGWSIGAAPVIGSTGAVLATQNQRLVCFDLETRSIRWEVPAGYNAQPAVRGGLVYVVQSGSLVVLNESTGKLLWSWTPSTGSLHGPVLLTQHHAVVQTGEKLFAISLRSRRPATSYPASGHLSFAEGTLYVSRADGTLLALGLGAPRFSSMSQVQFGPVRAGRSRRGALVVKNTGNVPLQVFEVNGLTVPFQYAGPGLPLAIPPRATATLTFTFAPGKKGTHRQKASIVTNDPQRPTIQIRLQGTGS